MKYFVTVGARGIVVEIDGDQVRIDSQPAVAKLEHVPGTPEIRVVVDGVVAVVVVDSEQGTLWRLVDQGAVRDVIVEDERSRHIRLLAGASRTTDGRGVVKAPMPGLVLRLLVAVGDTVVAATPLLALEAMKMENELKAIGPGVVRSVFVTPGQVVEKGQVLLELE